MRAWGLAMRKRFCRSFNFELQATADDDGLVLSMGPQHSFPLESLFSMLNERNARHLLEQALLAVPIFLTRWRWNITRSLLVARSKNGKKVPPALLRFRADDLLSAVFPQATGCLENSPGDVEIPDHPLVQQTMHDSLQEALDLEGLLGVLRQISQGEIELLARDTREPSPFCYELLNANPYAFLDGGEANERRSRAVATRRTLSAEELRDSGQLDLEAIRQVVQEARPLVRNPDELHDILLSRYLLPSEPAEPFAALDSAATGSSLSDAQDNALRPLREQPDWQPWLMALQSEQRAARVTWGAGHSGWVSAERWWAVKKRFPDAQLLGPLAELPPPDAELTEEQILVTLVRGVIEVCGPVTAAEIASELGLAEKTIFAALEAIEGEGLVLRGRYRNAPSWHAPAVSPEPPIEWCHRRLLARIHRLTLDGLRRQIEPVDIATFVRFLARHHALMPGTRRAGKNGVLETIQQLQGLDMAAGAWEREILPPRCENYRAESLDELCLSGEVGWSRLYPRPKLPDRARPISGIAKVCPVSLYCRDDLTWLRGDRPRVDGSDLSSPAQQIMELLSAQGAMFAADIGRACRMLPSHLTEALGELVAGGWVTSDTMVGLRALVTPAKSKSHGRASHQQTQSRVPLAGAGRWSLNWSHWPISGSAGASSPTSRAITSSRVTAARSPLARDTVPASDVPGSGASSPDGSTPDDFATGELLPTAVESWAWLLLRRWGIVFWDLLEREPGAPRWSEVVAVYRRLEARGEIRGGRFVTGVGGEQYALPHVVSQLRQLRDQGPVGEILIVSAVDPLNVVGLGNKQDRVPRRPGLKVVYLDGAPVAIISKGEVEWLGPPSARVAALLEKASRGKLKLRRAQSTAAQVAVNAATAKRPPDDTDQPADSETGDEKKRPKRRRPKPSQKPRQRWLFG